MPRYPRNAWITTIGSLLTDISSEMIVYLLPVFLAGVWPADGADRNHVAVEADARRALPINLDSGCKAG